MSIRYAPEGVEETHLAARRLPVRPCRWWTAVPTILPPKVVPCIVQINALARFEADFPIYPSDTVLEKQPPLQGE